jgi:hypothetical protein
MAKENTPQIAMPLPFVPRLRSLKSLRSTYARILRALAAGQLDLETARVWIYAVSVYLNIAKAQTEIEVLDRITAIEKRLNEIEKRGKGEKRSLSIAR